MNPRPPGMLIITTRQYLSAAFIFNATSSGGKKYHDYYRRTDTKADCQKQYNPFHRYPLHTAAIPSSIAGGLPKHCPTSRVPQPVSMTGRCLWSEVHRQEPDATIHGLRILQARLLTGPPIVLALPDFEAAPIFRLC